MSHLFLKRGKSRGIGSLGRSGFSLLEMLISITILSVSVLASLSLFRHLAHGVQAAKAKTLAVELVNEKFEELKNISYFRLMVTSSPVIETRVSPNFLYDGGYHPPESFIDSGGLRFERLVYIHKVIDDAGGNLIHRGWSDPDTGLKEVQVHVLYRVGNAWKTVGMASLSDDPKRNPVNAVISGTVVDLSADPVPGARVEVLQNPSWSAVTDSFGKYRFSVLAGTYSVRSTRRGYFPSASPETFLPVNGAQTIDLTLQEMSSGTLTGYAYLRDHVVISQVVCATQTKVGDLSTQEIEYVELFNPTTYPIHIGVTGGVKSLSLVYDDEDDSITSCPGVDPGEDRCDQEFDLVHVATYIPAGQYYLIANASYFMILGEWIVADAYYTSALNYPDYLNEHEAAAIKLMRWSENTVVDSVGWADNDDPAPFYEGSPIPDSASFDGMGEGNQIVRLSSVSTGASDSAGRAFDSGNNLFDFVYPGHPSLSSGLVYRPYSTSAGTQTILSGTPAAGGVVFASDNLAAATTVAADGSFQLSGVATGTWTLTVSSGYLTWETAAISVTSGSSQDTGLLVLSSFTTKGFITGWVSDIFGAGLAAISISGGDGGAGLTDASGHFRIEAGGGSRMIVVNAGNANPEYVSSEAQVTVDPGGLTDNVNFVLAKGATLWGFASTNGVDPLPRLAVVARQGALERRSTLSKADGSFYLRDLSTGSYVIETFPEAGDAVFPAAISRTIMQSDAGQTLFIGTFTVANALGAVVGTLEDQNIPIETGVLLALTSATIAGAPPPIDAAFRTASGNVYFASSRGDGTYRVQAPGGYTYNLYAWYTNAGGVTLRKDGVVAILPGNSQTLDISWP